MDEFCSQHSGQMVKCDELDKRCDQLRGVDGNQWDAINSKVGSKTLMWAFGIIAVIMLAVFGAVFGFQSKMEGKILNEIKEQNSSVRSEQITLGVKIDVIKDDLGTLKGEFKEYRRSQRNAGRKDD